MRKRLIVKLDPKTAFQNVFVTQAIAIICFVIVPGLVTLVAPRSTLEFRQSGDGVDVTVQRYVFLVVPWRTQIVAHATDIRADVTETTRYKDTRENRQKDRVGHTNLATGQVAILSAGPDVIVQAQPGLAEAIAAEFKAFAAAPSQTPVRRTVYASWVLTYVLGGVMTALCALYVVGASLAALKYILKKLRAA